jgi:carbamoyl-phosphate synthase small subunit
MNVQKAVLALEDGTVFNGISRGYVKDIAGEIVFNTGTTGYQEIITDPSYNQQIVVFTYPHIGNVGTNPDDNESKDFGVLGIVAQNIEEYDSNWRSTQSLPDFLREKKIPAISDIDTRKLTKIIRTKGTCRACILTSSLDPALAISKAQALDKSHAIELNSNAINLSTSLNNRLAGKTWKSPYITVYDAGVKLSILRQLTDHGARFNIISKDKGILGILEDQPDGCVISNGPGDPRLYTQEIEELKKFIKSGIPILGICLGAQLLALAMGAKIRQLAFGHHGINHPVLDKISQRVHIASQNHNYVIDEQHMPANMIITHTSLFDNTIQGFKVQDREIFGFQGHPEGGPGPRDLNQIFSDFLRLCNKRIVV